MVQSNLRALFQIDSWAVGVLVAMISGSLNVSPFAADADWRRGYLTPEAATRARIVEVRSDVSDFLMTLNGNSGGFVFRHGEELTPSPCVTAHPPPSGAHTTHTRLIIRERRSPLHTHAHG